jgi:predicted aspartyl protease
VSATKTYDGNTTSTGTPTGGDLLTGDTYTSTGTQVFDSKNAGPRTLTASGASINDGNNGANYTISYATASGSIAARGVTVSAVSATRRMMVRMLLQFHLRAGTLQEGDTYTSTGTQVFDSKNAGPRTLTASGASINDGNNGANYTISYATASGSIAARGVTVSAVSATKAYDGTDASSVSPSGGTLQEGDTYTSTGTQVFDSKNAGPRTLTASGASINDGNNGANYTISYATASGSIAARGVTVSAVTDSKTYNGTTASAGTPTGATLQTGDTYTSTGTQVFDSKNAGPRTLTASGASINDGNNGANYTISYATASGSIAARGVTVSAVSATKAYDGTDASSVSPSGGTLQEGDTYTSTGTQVF